MLPAAAADKARRFLEHRERGLTPGPGGVRVLAAMTKLGQWLCGLALLGSAWAALALAPPGLQPPAPLRQALLPLPVYLLVAFGCYSLATVGYRLATFNDCEEAAAELQEHIRAARADLRRRGLPL
ncbi:hypothetical protein HGM15179_007126 [Zosterops borbonicus]|uniref:Dolichol-phosphate mannosyltransferase subunit 3 n=1 Tax=Zosterops borbonicus TaxID=364589 RepID=A0A8K1GK45_9PASS|nr:hypothetical protein HGM15179_007126 [Zosterops borbonicus]